MKKGLKQREGSALLITLLIITTLTGLTMAFSEESGVELDLAGFSRDAHRAHEMARSGVNLALALLHKDKTRDMDSLQEDWARFGSEPFPDKLPEDLTFSGAVADESGKINLNALVSDEGKIDQDGERQLRMLFQALGLEDERVDPLLDWLDGDDTQRLHGAESDFYQGLPSPYRCPNGPLITIGQLFLVKGMHKIKAFGDEKQKRLLDYLTIYSGGKVNINTAPKEVLMCLTDKMDTSLAEAVMEFRKEKDFMKVDDLKKVPGVDDALFNLVKPWITVRSWAVSVESRGDCRGAKAEIKAILVREEERPRVIYWQVQ
ncbi:MAG: type II secretion system minor pseudopilin GspK [Deltaproteobacteria bacterium]|nr:type II secretion system minor pseudopilin GspK [Deltaproteobacteria bacterium]